MQSLSPVEPEAPQGAEPRGTTESAIPSAGSRPRGRVSAGHFRRLTAKLKHQEIEFPLSTAIKAGEISIPDLFVVPAGGPDLTAPDVAALPPVDVSSETIAGIPASEETELASAAFALPQFPEIPHFRPEPSLAGVLEAGTAIVEPQSVDETAAEATDLDIDPVELIEASEDAPETAIFAEPEIIAEAPADERLLEPEQEDEPDPIFESRAEPQPEFEVQPELQLTDELESVAQGPQHEPGTVESPEDTSRMPTVLPAMPEPELAKPVSQMADRVVDAMIKTIADSVYAKPSASERNAFLREVAELAKREGSPRPVPPPEPTPPPPAPITKTVTVAPAASVLLKSKPEPDVFAITFKALAEPKPAETAQADEESGELALSLLDMMSMGPASGLPQERALAADTLLRILPRIPVKQLLAVVERVAIMETPPDLLVAKLIRDPRPEVVAPLLERCMHITDQDLMGAAADADAGKRRMMARRRVISPVLADRLIALGDPSVVLTLVRNPGATFSHDAFYVLAEVAGEHTAILAPLVTRPDLPPPVAFELFWFVPPELRRYILSRFLTDSETLNKILRITLATGGDGDLPPADTRFPPRDTLETALNLVIDFRLDEAAQVLSDAGGVSRDTALRIFADREGEPMAVILKALGYPRGHLSDAMRRLGDGDHAIIRPGRVIEELQNVFDSLSFNKARILLTYWDWYVRKSGPYAPRH